MPFAAANCHWVPVVDIIDIVESQKLQVKSKNRGRASCGSYGYCGSSTNKSFDINIYRENGQLWILWIMWKPKKKGIS